MIKFTCLGIVMGIGATCAAAALLGLAAWWLGGLDEDGDAGTYYGS